MPTAEPGGLEHFRQYPLLKKCDRSFFERDAETLARDLIGAVLVHRVRGREYGARIVETEAYIGPQDLASHSSKGRTKRTEVMFGPAGHAYVYLVYGMHEMFNIVAGPTGSGQAVLIRAAEPPAGRKKNLSGPGKLANGLRITRAYNGLDLTGDRLFLMHDPELKPRIRRTKRIGCDYAGKWKDRLLRFVDADSKAVSK
jgi:DNA-3-methyladenine glycosylase